MLESHTNQIEQLLQEAQKMKLVNSELQNRNVGLEEDVATLKQENKELKHEIQVLSASLATSHLDINVELKEQPKVEIPHTLNDRYTLGEKLGEGGYSIVKAGISKIDGSKVAVKIITRKTLSPGDLESLYQEVKTLRSLDHAHIVRAFDFFEEEEYLYVVMECIEGGELFDRIVAKNYYNEQEARDLVLIVLNVLKFCHDKNIIHRLVLCYSRFVHS